MLFGQPKNGQSESCFSDLAVKDTQAFFPQPVAAILRKEGALDSSVLEFFHHLHDIDFEMIPGSPKSRLSEFYPKNLDQYLT